MKLAYRRTSFISHHRRPRRRGRHVGAGLAGVSVFGLLTFGRAASGCVDATCEHDWQCDEASICIPYQGRNQCVAAPVCTSSSECPGQKGCIVRSDRFVNTGSRDPFTSDLQGKRTCGGDDGPHDVMTESVGCGFSANLGAGGSGGGNTSYTSTSGSGTSGSSTGSFSSSSTATAGGAGTTTSGGGGASTSGSSTTSQTGSSGQTTSSGQTATSTGGGG